MTKRFSIVLAGLLIGMLVIGGSGIVGSNLVAYADDDQTEVYWGVTDGGCWLNFSAHDNLDLGSYTQIDVGSAINSENTGQGQKKVQVKTNCSYDLQVEATQFDLPADHPDDQSTAITNFAVKANKTGGSGNSNIPSYEPFTDLNTPIVVDSSGTGPNTTNYFMDYQYTWDANDVPGDYRVHLTYTASTT